MSLEMLNLRDVLDSEMRYAEHFLEKPALAGFSSAFHPIRFAARDLVNLERKTFLEIVRLAMESVRSYVLDDMQRQENLGRDAVSGSWSFKPFIQEAGGSYLSAVLWNPDLVRSR